MTQEIIVFIILGIVISYIVFTFFRRDQSKKSSACDGCSGCDLKKDLMCNLPDRTTPHLPQGEAKKTDKR
jgi:hypothetical protein